MADLRAWIVADKDAGARLDRFLDACMDDASRTRVQKWIADGCVFVNRKPARKSLSLEAGDTVTLALPERSQGASSASGVEPEEIALDVVYEDSHLAVINKPKGLVTHPGHGEPSGTLANALAFRFRKLSDLGGGDRPGIVHRLDRDTSGLLVVARTNAAHAELARQLAARDIHRTYRALIWREPSEVSGTFTSHLGRHAKDPVRRSVVSPEKLGAKLAITHWRVLDWFQFAAQVEVVLDTGRTHQIRVHFSHAGHPVAGDTLYGGGQPMLGRVPPLFQGAAAGMLKRLTSQALHAARLSFTHPATGKRMEFESPLPGEFRDTLEYLEKYRRVEEG